VSRLALFVVCGPLLFISAMLLLRADERRRRRQADAAEWRILRAESESKRRAYQAYGEPTLVSTTVDDRPTLPPLPTTATRSVCATRQAAWTGLPPGAKDRLRWVFDQEGVQLCDAEMVACKVGCGAKPGEPCDDIDDDDVTEWRAPERSEVRRAH